MKYVTREDDITVLQMSVRVTNCMNRVKLHTVGAEAGNIGKLQIESGEKAKMVAASSADTVEHSKQVLSMINQMQELLENTLSQANQIVQETETQKAVTKDVQESFHHVNDVSKVLLAIGREE